MKVYANDERLFAASEGNGSRVALYSPTNYTGYRQLVISAELREVPIWGITRTEWVALKLNRSGREIPVASRVADTLYSFAGVADWLTEILMEGN